MQKEKRNAKRKREILCARGALRGIELRFPSGAINKSVLSPKKNQCEFSPPSGFSRQALAIYI